MRTGIERHLRRPATRAFTLLEVLLALGLVVVLLATLWSVFGVFNRFFETTPARAEQAQLLSALWSQIVDDLQCAVEDSPPQGPQPPAAVRQPNASSMRRFGLIGTATSLRIDVLQPVPPEKRPISTAGPLEAARGDLGPRVPELRTITYDFIPPPSPAEAITNDASEAAEPAAEDGVEPPGLVRSEIDFETPLQASTDIAAASSPDLYDGMGRTVPVFASTKMGPSPFSGQGGRFTSSVGNPPPASTLGRTVTRIPEIVGVQFRYFDGNSWNGSWNSLQRKSLPVAVEIVLQVKPPDSSSPPKPATPADASPATEMDEWDEEFMEMAGIAEPAVPAHRFVVYLPAARIRPTVKTLQGITPSTMPAWPPAPRPFSTPPAATPSPPPQPFGPDVLPAAPARGRPAVLRPDQWMRIGT